MKLRKLILPILFLLAIASAHAAENIRLTVFHTNDIHGWVMPRTDREQKDRLVGGAATLSKALEKQREDGLPNLLLDAGDWFQGTPEGTISRGRIMADFFNALGYDAVVVGNHEYDIGEGELKALIQRIQAPVLGANIHTIATGKRVEYLKPYVVQEIAGLKVGIFGVLTSKMRSIQFAKKIEGLEFKDEVETAREMVGRLKAEGADVIIALTHIGVETSGRVGFVGDKTLAEKVPGIDLVIGGHTHTRLSGSKASGEGTLVVQAGSYLQYLGRIDLEIDPKTREVVSKKGELIKLWVDEFGRDERLLALVEDYRKRSSHTLDVVVGTAANDLHRSNTRDSGVGNWMTDCTRKWTKTQIAFQNGGGIRADLSAGAVTLRNMYEVMPFDNYVVTLNMTGEQVLRILETGVGGGHRLIQVSGMRFIFDGDAEAGRRVRKAWVGDRRLREDEIYSVSAPDFMVMGGDDYGAFRESKDKAFTQMMVRDLLTWCAKEYSPIRVVPGGRISRR